MLQAAGADVEQARQRQARTAVVAWDRDDCTAQAPYIAPFDAWERPSDAFR